MNWLLHSVALNSIERRAQAVAIPPLNDPGRLKRGLSLYRQDCVQCHGGPGEAPASFAMGFMPGAPPLIQVAKEWPANEIYWAVRNGIKMTAMPPWHYRMTDDEVWDVVAFVETLPTLSLADYKTQAAAASASASDGKETAPGPAMTGDIDRGKVALGQYACAACHTIPGIVAPPGHVGPTLAGMSQRSVIAGLLANTPEDMVAWIRHPQTISPGTAMPDMGVSAQDAGDMAAYLTSLK
ncbi:MAG TPA: c-type cytochrome [Alphaproteobacteria bacterium]|nr:c-type cytochrome [Alphaproteobacteria bacterium]